MSQANMDRDPSLKTVGHDVAQGPRYLRCDALRPSRRAWRKFPRNTAEALGE
jgi:hypothetical protein